MCRRNTGEIIRIFRLCLLKLHYVCWFPCCQHADQILSNLPASQKRWACLSYVGVNYQTGRSPELWHIPPETPCICHSTIVQPAVTETPCIYHTIVQHAVTETPCICHNTIRTACRHTGQISGPDGVPLCSFSALTADLNTFPPKRDLESPVRWRCFVGWPVADVANHLMSLTAWVSRQHGVTYRKNWIFSFCKFIQFMLKTWGRGGFCAICRTHCGSNVGA